MSIRMVFMILAQGLLGWSVRWGGQPGPSDSPSLSLTLMLGVDARETIIQRVQMAAPVEDHATRNALETHRTA